MVLTVCLGLYLAIPKNFEPPSPPANWTDAEGFAAWPVMNPWIPTIFGREFSCWVLGHAGYCSCGCIVESVARPDDILERVSLAPIALQYLAFLAESTNFAFLIHWANSNYEDEELPFEVSASVSQIELLRKPDLMFNVDSFLWVASGG
jgi:hypothetical protein